MVSRETGENLSLNKDYFNWFAETLGKNVGLMHKNGLLHDYLGDHNITLDCRIVDAGNVKKFKSGKKGEKQRMRDISWAKKSLRSLANSLGFEKNFSEFENQFLESYDNIFLPDSVKKRRDSLHA